MSLMYLSDRALAQLRHDLPRNQARYNAEDPWLSESVLGPKWCREANINVGMLPRLEGTKPADDLQNTRLIHSALKTLTPVQAMDERLWVLLAHTTYWKYMHARWGSDSVASRFFFKNRGISGLTLHGIARLWWFGQVTYDATRTDPYELTQALLSVQDVQTGLLQRNLGRSRRVRSAALTFLGQNEREIEKIGTKRGGPGEVVKHLCKNLNLVGGVRLLDALEESQLHQVLGASLQEFAS